LAKVYWDTNLFVYYFEDLAALADRVDAIWRGMLQRGDDLYTGTITVGEILVRPRSLGQEILARKYLRYFEGNTVTVVPFDLKAADHYARIRTNPSIQRADAMQLACAAAADADLFITNDARLSKKRVAGIKFITSLEHAPL